MKTWKVNGLVFLTGTQKFLGMHKKKFVVRYTSDEIGKSLSIADEKSGVMFQIPFDSILKQIMEEEQ